MDETVIEGRRVSLIYSGQVFSEGSCDPVESAGCIEDQGESSKDLLDAWRRGKRRRETKGVKKGRGE